jgi:hypothetical protein
VNEKVLLATFSVMPEGEPDGHLLVKAFGQRGGGAPRVGGGAPTRAGEQGGVGGG